MADSRSHRVLTGPGSSTQTSPVGVGQTGFPPFRAEDPIWCIPLVTTGNLPSLPGRLVLIGPEETKVVGTLIGLALKKENIPSFLITLEGPLGAGKTTLCQGLAEAMGVEPREVVSPTFTLCNVYRTEKPLFHLDLYRLEPETAAEEFVGSGLEECFDGLCLVEWPDRLGKRFWPEERLELVFEINDESRVLTAQGISPVASRIWLAVNNSGLG